MYKYFFLIFPVVLLMKETKEELEIFAQKHKNRLEQNRIWAAKNRKENKEEYNSKMKVYMKARREKIKREAAIKKFDQFVKVEKERELNE